MRLTKTILICAALAAGAVTTGSAFAHHGWHGRVGVGIYLGGPAYWGYPGYYPGPGYYYPPPYYSYPPYYGVPGPGVAPEEPAYIERDAAPPAPSARPRGRSSWFYCPESKGYYPYVKECPGGWQRVAPEPPAASGGSER